MQDAPDVADAAPDSDQPATPDWADQMQQLPQLNDDQIADLEATLLSAFEEADQADDLDQMAQIAAALESVRDEVASRGGNPDDPDGDGDQDGTPGGEDPDEPDDAVTAAGESAPVGEPAPTGAPPPEPVAATESEPERSESSGSPEPDQSTEPAAPQQPATETAPKEAPVAEPEIPADRAPVPTEPTVRTAVTAGADIPGYSAGTEITNLRDLGTAFANRLRGIRDSRGSDGDQLVIATITASLMDDSRVLVPNDAEGNAAKIAAFTDPKAILAAGGYCAPLEVNYNIFGLGVTNRPVKDALAGFQVDRGGIRYIAPPVLTDLEGAVSLWTAANDANPTNPTTKPCLTVECQPEQTAIVDAIPLCLKFGNLMTRAFPELINRNNDLALVWQARFAEMNLLSKLTSLSTAVSSTKTYGTAIDSLQAIAKVAVGYRQRHRMDPEDMLRVIAPVPLLASIREDYSLRTGVTDLAVTDAVIQSWFAARNINISWTVDEGMMGPQAAGPINDFPTSFRFWIYAEGTFLFLDGGTLDIGLVRDSELVGTNDYKMFSETFEQVAKVGIEGIVATVNTGVSGLVGGYAHAGATP